MNRPTGVTIIAVLSFLGAFLLGIIACGFLLGGAIVTTLGMSIPSSLVGIGAVVAALFFFALGALYIFNGIGLLKLQNGPAFSPSFWSAWVSCRPLWACSVDSSISASS